MEKPFNLGRIIARRELLERGTNRSIGITVGEQQQQSADEWICPYAIEYMEKRTV